jgi:hypothetical protein
MGRPVMTPEDQEALAIGQAVWDELTHAAEYADEVDE